MKKDKTRDMIRSILPSKARRQARQDKAILKRESRRSVRADLRKEDAETTKVDFRRYPSMKWVVSDRRGADKLGHFLRWCEKQTAGMSTEEKLGFVRGLLPRNLIGDHAYGHWEDKVRPYFSYPRKRRRTQQSITDSARFRLRRALEIDPDLQRRLNAAIKARKQEGEPRRMLFGIHDIEEFIDTIFKDPIFAIERNTMFELVSEIDKKGGAKPPFQFWAIASPNARSKVLRALSTSSRRWMTAAERMTPRRLGFGL